MDRPRFQYLRKEKAGLSAAEAWESRSPAWTLPGSAPCLLLADHVLSCACWPSPARSTLFSRRKTRCWGTNPPVCMRRGWATGWWPKGTSHPALFSMKTFVSDGCSPSKMSLDSKKYNKTLSYTFQIRKTSEMPVTAVTSRLPLPPAYGPSIRGTDDPRSPVRLPHQVQAWLSMMYFSLASYHLNCMNVLFNNKVRGGNVLVSRNNLRA